MKNPIAGSIKCPLEVATSVYPVGPFEVISILWALIFLTVVLTAGVFERVPKFTSVEVETIPVLVGSVSEHPVVFPKLTASLLVVVPVIVKVE